MKNESSKVNGKRIFERRGKIFAYCMVSIAVVHFLIFFVYLNFEQFRMAFAYELADGSEKFTFDNFTKIFTDLQLPNSIMLYSLVNTIQYWLMGVVKLIITVFVSYFLWKKVAGNKLFIILFFFYTISNIFFCKHAFIFNKFFHLTNIYMLKITRMNINY